MEWNSPNTLPMDGERFIASISYPADHVMVVKWSDITERFITDYAHWIRTEHIRGWMPLPEPIKGE
jgi:hypothetical protein